MSFEKGCKPEKDCMKLVTERMGLVKDCMKSQKDYTTQNESLATAMDTAK